jgi:hypothetical protein
VLFRITAPATTRGDRDAAVRRVEELEALVRTDAETYGAFLERARRDLKALESGGGGSREVRAPHAGNVVAKVEAGATVKRGPLLALVEDPDAAIVRLERALALSKVTTRWRCEIAGASRCRVAKARRGKVELQIDGEAAEGAEVALSPRG